MARDMKDRIDKLVDIFVNYAAGVGADAGWHGPHRLGMILDFHGDVPPPNGNDRSDVQAINEIRYLRRAHADFNLACMLLGRLAKQKEKYVTALIARRYLQHVYKRPFNDGEIAEELGERLPVYRHNRKKAYQVLSDALNFIDEY